MARLRAVHLEMLDAVLSGDGLERVATLAADAAGAPVAIVMPRLGAAVAGDAAAPGATPAATRCGATSPTGGRPAVARAGGRHAEVPIGSGDELVGAVLLLGPATGAEAAEFLHLAAVASLTEVAVEEAREEVEENLRGSFLEDLRARPDLEGDEVVRRAARLGCDLSAGAVACARSSRATGRATSWRRSPRTPRARSPSTWTGACTRSCPAAATRRGGARRGPAASPSGCAPRPVGLSSFYADPAELGRSIQEAELVLDVVRRSGAPIEQDIGTGTYRLLFRVLASHPEEVRSFYEDTVAPVVRYDDQYRTDLVGTLEAYLEHNCNMNATAAAIYAHRHTVAYRLERVRELTGLDPVLSEDRERLGLGLKAYRIIAPRLPR